MASAYLVLLGGISLGQKAGMGIVSLLVGVSPTYFQCVPSQAQSEFSLMGLRLMKINAVDLLWAD